MVFGFFSRKLAAPVDATSSSGTADHHRVQQLRTPSPSIASGQSIGNPTNSPTHSTTIRPNPRLISPNPNATVQLPPPTTDPTALRSLLLTIPPKILHEYLLTHLSPVPPSLVLDSETTPPAPTLSPLTLTVLTSFFSALTPPPLLHCARCHKGFFDVENDDRSCTIGHDDESAEVERVGRGAGYETLWGCCGKTVEGDGDMGPPDGWCYEGKHTTDTKRARFRADSTIYDDKLVPCHKLRCHGVPHAQVQPRASSSVSVSVSGSTRTRKRPRRSMRDSSGSEGEEEEEDASNVGGRKRKAGGMLGRSMSVGAASVRSRTGGSTKGKGKARAVQDEEDDVDMNGAVEDDDEDDEATQAISIPVPKAKAKAASRPKAKPGPKPKSSVKPTTPKKPTSTTTGPGPTTRRATSATPRSTERKSALAKKLSEAFVADSEAEREREAGEGEGEKSRKKRKIA